MLAEGSTWRLAASIPAAHATPRAPMTEIRRIRRAGGNALRLLVDLLPEDWDPRSGDEDVALVFADVEGYSNFVAETGDDAAMAVLRVLDQVVEAALTGRKGARVVKRLGDGVMISARRSEDALRISTAIVREFGAEMRELAWPLRLRAGTHRGTCRRQGDDYFGYHVNLAARVAEHAAGAQVLATPHVLAGVDLPTIGLDAVPEGTLRAKGVPAPLQLFSVAEPDRRPPEVAAHAHRRAS
jgi:adenylate cyclase